VGAVKSAGDLNLSEPEETGVTYEENAILKAKAALAETGLPSLADDSGLSVYALNGEPGVYSARYAGPERDFKMAMGKINDRLANNDNRKAAFVAVLALAYPDGRVVT